MNANIREIEEEDLKTFIDLLQEQFRQEGSNKAQLESRALKCFHSPSLSILISFDHSAIHGYVIIHWIQEIWNETEESLISDLYVIPSSRNIGIGTALLEAAVQYAKSKGSPRIWLENNRNNPIYSRQYYQKRGWKERQELVTFDFPKNNNDSPILLKSEKKS